MTAVHDGAAAIEEALASRTGVALIDLGMPGMDGFEVARQLRDELSMAGTVLVAVTGNVGAPRLLLPPPDEAFLLDA